tara:strand:+ start:16890 stop:17912 length:1023 start_codon:yes stop_codon:yes gene_type:complete
MRIIINKKCFPFISNGGTAITTFEQGCISSEKRETIVFIPNFLVFKDRKFIWDNLLIIEGNPFNLIFLIIKKKYIVKSFFINSAFQFYGSFFALWGYFLKINIFWSGHGSFDQILFRGFKGKINLLRLILFDLPISFICDEYVLVSNKEFVNLLNLIKRNIRKFKVINNRPPIHMLKYILYKNGLESISDIPYPKFVPFKQKNNYLLFIGRVVPKKMVLETIREFNLCKEFDLNLIIAHSNDEENYLNSCKNEVKQLKLNNKIFFLKDIFGIEKLSLIKYSKAGILLSKSEGNPMFLQECIMLNKNVIATPSCNLSESKYLILCEDIKGLSISIEELFSK